MVADDGVDESVPIQIQQSRAVVLPLFVAKGEASEHVFLDPLLRLAEVEELDPLSVFLHRVVDELHELLIAAPSPRMKYESHRPLPGDGGIQRRLPIGQQSRADVSLDVE